MRNVDKNNESHIDVTLCDDTMSFKECELTIVRNAIMESENVKKEKINTVDIRKMVAIVEKFIKEKGLICYGGTAINNVLPPEAQFYDRAFEIPDYDFFSSSPLEDCKELADIYFASGFIDVEAKAGIHYGTFKVFVNYTPMADITYMHPDLFKRIQSEAITIDRINYCPVNYLRMNMYLELSRPSGDVSRWDKVFRRLMLLNEYYPIKISAICELDRTDDGATIVDNVTSQKLKYVQQIIQEEMADLGAVFFGGYAASLYGKYMNDKSARIASNVTCSDVIYEDISGAVTILTKILNEIDAGIITVIQHEEFNDMIPRHAEIRVNDEPVILIYEPIACHNYNVFKIGKQSLNIATIDTMMTFYLAFYYTDKPSLDRERIFCMVQFLFDISQKWLKDNGILKRYSVQCYGFQPTLADIRAKKTSKRKDKKIIQGSKEFEMWFLNYKPSDIEDKKRLKLKKMENIKNMNGNPSKRNSYKKKSSMMKYTRKNNSQNLLKKK